MQFLAVRTDNCLHCQGFLTENLKIINTYWVSEQRTVYYSNGFTTPFSGFQVRKKCVRFLRSIEPVLLPKSITCSVDVEHALLPKNRFCGQRTCCDKLCGHRICSMTKEHVLWPNNMVDRHGTCSLVKENILFRRSLSEGLEGGGSRSHPSSDRI